MSGLSDGGQPKQMATLRSEGRIVRLAAVRLQQPHTSDFYQLIRDPGGSQRLVSCSLLSGDVNKSWCWGGEEGGGGTDIWPPTPETARAAAGDKL